MHGPSLTCLKAALRLPAIYVTRALHESEQRAGYGTPDCRGGGAAFRVGGDCLAERRPADPRTPDAIVRLALSPGGPVRALIKSTSIEVLGG